MSTDKKITLRPADSRDWPAIEALLLANGLPLDGAREHLASFVLAIMERAIVGSAGLEIHGDVALLRSVAVAAGRHREGIGAQLVDERIQHARSRGLASLHLLTTTAEAYFARKGFQPRARDEGPPALRASAEFTGACPASAVFMSLGLAGEPETWRRPGTSIRVATPSDAQAVADIYGPIVRDTSISFELEPPNAEQMRERITSTLQSLPWLVSEDAQGAVTGYAYASRHRERAAYQWSVDTTIYLRADARGQGIGRQLYDELKRMLRELGYLQAFAGIALPNAASVALHEAVGFKPIGVYRNVGFKQGQWRDVGWWQCGLGPLRGEPKPPIAFDAAKMSAPLPRR